jgi:hypothetical protein
MDKSNRSLGGACEIRGHNLCYKSHRLILVRIGLINEDEYQIHQLENFVHFPIQYYICNRIDKYEVERLLQVNDQRSEQNDWINSGIDNALNLGSYYPDNI